MTRLSDLVNINEKFQNSINLQLDIDNREKINNYIPTAASVKVLSEFLDNIWENKDNANILIGPYGKGKSHLLLVLLGIISGKFTTNRLIGKIEKTDSKAADMARKIQNGKPYLPIIVSGSDENLNQAFLIGLIEALKRNNLQDVAPDSYYGEALKVIDKWKRDYRETYKELGEKLGEYNLSIEKMVKMLGKMDRKMLGLFTAIYPQLTAGSRFNPMIQTESFKTYAGVVRKLCEEHGYGGVYIIFDEFSKYVEGHLPETFSRDMKILQDMCELATNSKEYPVHITFVAHKSIKEYGKALPKEMINAFTGVEGRLKEKRFIVSAHNNYELIKYAIEKNGTKYKAVIEEDKLNKEIIDKSYNIPCFEGVFEKKDYRKTVAYGCFPLLPVTAYCLLSISEKVGQNERSIFTFIANNEKGSLVNLVNKAKDSKLIAVDAIYDYFENLFRENTASTAIHNEWLKAQYALGKAATQNEKKIIKAVAILTMIKNTEELPARKDTLRLATGLEHDVFCNALEELQDKEILVYRKRLGIFAFKNNVGVNIEKEIDMAIKKQINGFNIAQETGKVSELKYEFPKKYNQEYTMTRFFRYEYMTQKQFLKLKDAKYLFEEEFSDGKIICIIREDDTDEESIKAHVEKLDDKRIIVICPNFKFRQEKNLKRLIVIQKLLKDDSFLEENKVLKQELELYKEDILFEINAELESVYIPEKENCHIFYLDRERDDIKTEKEYNRFLSEICESYYLEAPKVNNELINRENVSAQIKKARKEILNCILEERDWEKYETGTSPEATIFRATLLHTGIMSGKKYAGIQLDEGCRKILKKIRSFIEKCAGRRMSFEKLYNELQGEKYGTRKGIIPIFIAKELVALQDTPVIYLEDKEIEISGDVLENINLESKKYYLFIESESIEKENYLKLLEQTFIIGDEDRVGTTKRNRLSRIVDGMQHWYRALDQYTLNFKEQVVADRKMDSALFEKACDFRAIFKYMDLNPRQVLFEEILQALACDNYEECGNMIKVIKEFFDNNLYQLKSKMAAEAKAVFCADKKESLAAVLNDWYTRQGSKAKNHILNDVVTGFMSYLERINTNDEHEIISRISKIITGTYIDDWKDGMPETFIKALKDVKNQIEALKNDVDENDSGENKVSFTDSDGNIIEKYYSADEDDSVSYFLKNAIEDALDEFGDTLELNQKVSVMVQALEKILKQ